MKQKELNIMQDYNKTGKFSVPFVIYNSSKIMFPFSLF